MADIGKNVKSAWMKGMEFIGNTASSIASSTKYKVDEMNLINKRRDILDNFGARAYELWQKGETFPEELDRMLKELNSLDEQLNALRVQKTTGEEAAPAAEPEEKPAEEPAVPVIEVKEPAAEAPAPAPEAEPENAPEEEPVPVDIPSPEENAGRLDEVINDLFGNAPSVDDMAGKVNKALDSLGENLKKFAENVDQGISDLADRIRDNDKKDE